MKKRRKISFSFALKMGLILCAIFLVTASVLLLVSAVFDLFDTDFFLARPLLLVVFGFAALTLIGSLALFLIIKFQTRRVDELRRAFAEVANGNYDVQLSDPGRDDFFYAEIVEDFSILVDRLRSTAILQSDFASNFSHEFKTPIASIKGYAEILEKHPDLSEEERRKYLRIVIDEAERLSGLAASTLLLSRLDSRKSLDGLEAVDIGAQIEECVLLLDSLLQERQIEIELDLRPHTIRANAALLKEVWINLLQNAVKYNRDGGSISVTAAPVPEGYAVRIADTGIGMDERTRERIFDRYFQADSSRSGNGLGLSIARRIVELTGGRISVESVPDKGSVFTVLFPESGR